MVKLKGPSLSIDASGSLADILTFSTSKGRAYVKHKPTPDQPRSGNQVSMRAMMQFLSQQWQNLTAGNQATWADAYPDPSLSNYNAFIKHNLIRWRNKWAPSKEYPAAETGNAGDLVGIETPNGVRHIKISARNAMNQNQIWGVLLFHSLTSTPGNDLSKLVHVFHIPVKDTWYYWTHSPLTAGTHYYRITGITTTGKLDTTKTATGSGVVT